MTCGSYRDTHRAAAADDNISDSCYCRHTAVCGYTNGELRADCLSCSDGEDRE